jgi:hypothetical protein
MQLPRIRGSLSTVNAWSPHLNNRCVELDPLFKSSRAESDEAVRCKQNRRMHRQRPMRPETGLRISRPTLWHQLVTPDLKYVSTNSPYHLTTPPAL